jgi:hypothetical protein
MRSTRSGLDEGFTKSDCIGKALFPDIIAAFTLEAHNIYFPTVIFVVLEPYRLQAGLDFKSFACFRRHRIAVGKSGLIRLILLLVTAHNIAVILNFNILYIVKIRK